MSIKLRNLRTLEDRPIFEDVYWRQVVEHKLLRDEAVDLLRDAFGNLSRHGKWYGFYKMASLFDLPAAPNGWEMFLTQVKDGQHVDTLRALAGPHCLTILKVLEARKQDAL